MAQAGVDFGGSQHSKDKLHNWKFPEAPDVRAYLSKAVDAKVEAITFVCHERRDGVWQFLGDTMAESGAVVVCLHHPIDGDPSLAELSDLPRGWYAEREKPGAPWVRGEMQEEEWPETL